jgi:hypothetical protein
MPRASQATVLAQRLLDAHVAHQLEDLSAERVTATAAAVADEVLEGLGECQLEDLVDRGVLTDVIVRALASTPESAAVRGIVEIVTGIAHAGPPEPVDLSTVADREQVAELVDAVIDLHPVLEQTLDGLTRSPLVGTVAARFMARVVGEAMQANQELAGRVPGLGSLVSFGTNATTRMVGAADRQLSGMLADSMGRGGAFAIRRLNRVLIDTITDPTTREAVLQVWDLTSEDPYAGAVPFGVTPEMAHGVVGAVHELTISALGHEQTAGLVAAIVDGFLDHFGGYTPTELLDELGLDRAEVVADVVALAARAVEALRDSGALEAIVRARLEPFYTSAAVREILSS